MSFDTQSLEDRLATFTDRTLHGESVELDSDPELRKLEESVKSLWDTFGYESPPKDMSVRIENVLRAEWKKKAPVRKASPSLWQQVLAWFNSLTSSQQSTFRMAAAMGAMILVAGAILLLSPTISGEDLPATAWIEEPLSIVAFGVIAVGTLVLLVLILRKPR